MTRQGKEQVGMETKCVCVCVCVCVCHDTGVSLSPSCGLVGVYCCSWGASCHN